MLIFLGDRLENHVFMIVKFKSILLHYKFYLILYHIKISFLSFIVPLG